MNTSKLLYLFVGFFLFSFVACDDAIDNAPTPSVKVNTEVTTFSESFQDGIGDFSVVSVAGKQHWSQTQIQGVMMAGSIDNVAYANECWLISPAVSLPKELTSVFTFDYVTRKFMDISNEATIWISEDYKADSLPSKATWTQVYSTEPIVNAAGWTMTNAGDISLKAYMGKTVRIAFKYTSSIVSAGTWQIKNFIVKDRLPVTLPYLESFALNKGKFTTVNVLGDQVWGWDSYGKYMKMTGRVGSTNNINEDWLISPQVDLTKVASAKLSFDHVARYFTQKTEATVWISEDYDEGSPLNAKWTQLQTYPFADPGNWTLSTSYELSLTAYAGKKISIAFKYVSSAANSGTWEVKNVHVQEGEPADIIFIEPLIENIGKFTTESKLGAQVWNFNAASKYAVMSGFANGISNANEDWLISPSIDLTGKTSAKLSFDHTINKGLVSNMQTNHTLWLSADNGTTWEQCTIPTYPAGNNWTFTNTGKIVIPAKYLGVSTFKFALKYLCSTTESASWEVRNFIIAK